MKVYALAIFGCVLAIAVCEGLVYAAPIPEVSWNAADPGGSPATGWAPAINTSTATDANLTWANSGAALNASPTTNVAGITAAYEFHDAADEMTFSNSLFENRISPNASASSATIEMWLRPLSFPISGNPQLIHEAGGTGNGISVWLDGSEITFNMDEGSNQTSVTADLSTISGFDASDFFQAVLVYDRNPATGVNDNLSLYIDGLLEDTATGAINDFAGADGSGLSGIVNVPAEGTPSPIDTFLGDIAIFNYYRAALTGDEVLEAFEAVNPQVVPEPSSYAVWLILTAVFAGCAVLRRRQHDHANHE